MQRYCAACWKQRFGWLPDRIERHPPQKKRRRVQRRISSSHAKRPSARTVGSLQVTTIEVHQLDSAGNEDDKEGSSRSASRSDESAKSVALCKSSEEPASQSSEGSLSNDPDTATTAASSQASQEPDWSQPGCSATASALASPSPSPSAATEMCTICLVRPKCAILIHGRTSHRLTCYKCAKTLERKNLPCPVCRRHIQRVVRNFDA